MATNKPGDSGLKTLGRRVARAIANWAQNIGVRVLRVLEGETRVSNGWGFLTLGAPAALAIYLFQFVEAHDTPPLHFWWAWPSIYVCVGLSVVGLFLLVAPRVRDAWSVRHPHDDPGPAKSFAEGAARFNRWGPQRSNADPARLRPFRSARGVPEIVVSQGSGPVVDGIARIDTWHTGQPLRQEGDLPLAIESDGWEGSRHWTSNWWNWKLYQLAIVNRSPDRIVCRVRLLTQTKSPLGHSPQELKRMPDDEVVSIPGDGHCQIDLEFSEKHGDEGEEPFLPQTAKLVLVFLEIGTERELRVSYP